MNDVAEQRRNETWKKILVILMLILSFVCFGFMVYFQSHHKLVVMSFRLPEVDIGAVQIPSDDNPLPFVPAAPEGGGAGSVTYSDEVDVNLDEGTVDLLFQNPAGSGTSMVLHVLINGREIGSTGLLPAGYAVETIHDFDAGSLAPGYYPGSFVIDHYDPDTGEKAIFSLDIETTVHVSGSTQG